MSTLDQLRAVRAYIDEHFDEPLSLDELAQVAHVSRYHFIRLFQRFFYETPHQYLTRKRLEQAKYLLANSTLSVTDICFAVGFESMGDPIFSSVMMITEPVLLLGTLLLAVSTLRARVLSPWPAWLLLAALAGIVVLPFTSLPDTGVEYTAVVFYLSLAGFGVSLLTDKVTKAAAVNQ